MSKVIAGIYEIDHKIGAGGGGTVYLGKHQRLEKQIVLKADKRRLSTKPEMLRREVDMLKDLSHTYIPQVYDFVQEDGIVYTVMDYIDGESLDKLLARGQKISQAEIVKWACQLLRALVYLHSRPPHGILHGDIKPANIMLRPGGDICLIDYNIALALGEDGAVKVGFSRGYASPEHYGAEYLKEGKAAAVEQILTTGKAESGETTEVDDPEKTETDDEKISRNLYSGKTSGSGRGLLLDVRSDIYSLGATLYHLLSGSRPAQDAREVVPLGQEVCSPAVAKIIQKAMEPEPSMRYQTAQEMLEDFLQLHKKDGRVIRRKKRIIACAAVISGLFLAGGGGCFVGLKQLENRQEALTLSEYSANALSEGDVPAAIDLAMRAIPNGKIILEASVTPQAQKALTDALGVYDLSDGFKALDTLELPSAPFCLAVSPEGTRFAAVYAYEAAVFEMEDQSKEVVLPIQNSALSDLIFTDESHIIYAGAEGITAYDLENQKVLWTGDAATTLTVSGDKSIVAAVNRDDDHALLYRVSDGSRIGEISFEGRRMSVAANDIFADPQNDIFTLNIDGTLLAASFSDGSVTVFGLNDPENGIILYDSSDYRHFAGGFHGRYFAFTAENDREAVFGLIDTEEAVLMGSFSSQDPLLLQADEEKVCLANGNLLISLDPETMEERELAYVNGANITAFSAESEYVLTVTDDQRFCFFDSGANPVSEESCEENSDFVILTESHALIGNRNEPELRVLKLENHKEEQIFSYDARYGHEEARLSADGEHAMLFDYKGFRIYDKAGELIAETEMPDARNIYDQQFRRDGENSWLEVIWYDGTIRCYSAKDGSLIKEEKGEKPEKDLQEEFYVSKYRIVSPLHSAPEVYDVDSGRLIALLEEEDYLTYVTETGEYIITEYINTDGERYGILLNQNLEKLAYLPRLSDICGDTLVFDYQSGNLRQCPVYTLSELVEMGETYLSEKENAPNG
ncbi:MAG: serine/threonine protein kinase [Lachnospiraceae bacterium]|nr:serine/threonine protein kinase [Lachnospiraceae bacterium]